MIFYPTNVINSFLYYNNLNILINSSTKILNILITVQQKFNYNHTSLCYEKLGYEFSEYTY